MATRQYAQSGKGSLVGTDQGRVAPGAGSIPGVKPVESPGQAGDPIDSVKAALDAARARDFGPLQIKIVGAGDALDDARKLLWASADRFAELAGAEKSAVNDMATGQAESSVARFGSPGRNRVTEVEDARQKFLQQAGRALRNRVAAEFADKAQPIGQTAATSMSAARTAIDFEGQRLIFWPGSLADPTLTPEADLVQTIKSEQRRYDMSTKEPREIKDMWRSAIDAGQDSVAIQIEVASEAYLQEITNKGSSAFSAKKPGMRDGIASEQVQIARQLLFEFAKRREARLPQWLTSADEVYTGTLLPIFRTLLGVQAARLPMEAIFAAARNGGIGLEIDLAWVARGIDTGVEGWTPIRGRNQFGVHR